VNCEICRHLAERADEPFVVRTTQHWHVSLAHDQLYLGRAYVTARFHAGRMSDLPPEARAEFYEDVWPDYELRVEKAFGAADPFNWTYLNNNAYKNAMANPHVHWHVRPRYAWAPHALGQIWLDPNYGHHYARDNHRKVNNDILARLAGLLREVR
jgi:diadenosine tetraphosphate (Ap4A) HIT family hydrolase